jgi:hypothetical protein
MTSKEEYEARIAQCDWSDLLDLWDAIEARDTPGWGPGKAFEYLVLRAFQLEGAEVGWPYTVNLGEELVEQIDGVVYTDGLACILESKDQGAPTNVEPIAKLRNQLFRRPGGTIGAVFSRAGFTEPARILAQFVAPQTILLWEGAEVRYALKTHRFRTVLCRKYRHLIEHGIPDHNVYSEEL